MAARDSKKSNKWRPNPCRTATNVPPGVAAAQRLAELTKRLSEQTQLGPDATTEPIDEPEPDPPATKPRYEPRGLGGKEKPEGAEGVAPDLEDFDSPESEKISRKAGGKKSASRKDGANDKKKDNVEKDEATNKKGNVGDKVDAGKKAQAADDAKKADGAGKKDSGQDGKANEVSSPAGTLQKGQSKDATSKEGTSKPGTIVSPGGSVIPPPSLGGVGGTGFTSPGGTFYATVGQRFQSPGGTWRDAGGGFQSPGGTWHSGKPGFVSPGGTFYATAGQRFQSPGGTWRDAAGGYQSPGGTWYPGKTPGFTSPGGTFYPGGWTSPGGTLHLDDEGMSFDSQGRLKVIGSPKCENKPLAELEQENLSDTALRQKLQALELSEAECYLEDHDIARLLREVTVELCLSRPDDHVSFLANYFANKERGDRFSYGDSQQLDDLEELQAARQTYRRIGISAPPIDEEAAEHFQPKVVPKDRRTTIHLESAVANHHLFRDLGPSQKMILFDAMFPVVKQKGDVIIKQGEDGDNFYIIDHGEVEIDVDGRVVAKLNQGESFGELALMYSTPRAATVTALASTRLFAIDRETYRVVIMASMIKRRRLYTELLDKCAFLETMSSYERTQLADVLSEEIYNDGEKVFSQGDNAEDFYIIVSGQALILKKSGSKQQEKQVNKLGPGDYFGEMALILSKPRAATVQAKGRLEVAKVERDKFERVMGPVVDILKRNMKNYNIILQKEHT